MDILELERQRQALEMNLAKLRTSLKHYQTYCAELEGLKEEIAQTKGDRVDFKTIGNTYNGHVVGEKEILELAGLPDAKRSTAQVLDEISDRQDHIQRTLETVQKQFFDHEAKLEEVDFAVASANRNFTAGSLPLTEIHEELDDDGNVLSSSLFHPEAQTTEILDALHRTGLSPESFAEGSQPVVAAGDENDDEVAKAGAQPIPRSALVDNKLKAPGGPKSITQINRGRDLDTPQLSIRKKSVSFTADTKLPPTIARQESEDGKKFVSFADKVAVMPAAPQPDSRTVSFSPKVEEIPVTSSTTESSEAFKTIASFQTSLKGFAFKPGERVGQINADDELSAVVVIPENESEEDAISRREMLDYHLNEVGHVVAQMDIDYDEDLDDCDEDEVSDVAASEYLDEDTPYTSGHSESDGESEDEFGRSKRRVISNAYHKEMRDLESKLIGNLGPMSSTGKISYLKANLHPQDAYRLVVSDDVEAATAGDTEASNRAALTKRVSFAETEGVSQDAAQSDRSTSMVDAAAREAVAEQSSPTVLPILEATSDQTSVSSDVSKSANARAATHPEGQVIADRLYERPSRKTQVAATSADDRHLMMQRRELAAEYYRRRNEIVRQQGGFTAPLDEERVDLVEERDGRVRKVSRFKAARINS